ncbi:MAG TPA: hypothetical protein VF927_07545, partial [Solirubrobacteraceae bacterium]
AVRVHGLTVWCWLAFSALVLGLLLAAILLAPWRLRFAVNARELYSELYREAAGEAESGSLGWLASAGFGYERLRANNDERVSLMALLSGAVGVLMVAQTLAWLAALA